MKLLVAGDFVPNSRVEEQISCGKYSCLSELRGFIQSFDYAIVNLESPVVIREASPIKKTGPNLKCDEKAVECIAKSGFDCITLANNHFFDYGQVGVEDTIRVCKENELDYLGGGLSLKAAQQILYKQFNTSIVAFVNFCENEWSIANEKQGGSAPQDLVHNYRTIKNAHENADVVIVIVHGGIEHYQYPTPMMQDRYRFFIDIGADVVINHHQHCFSGYERYNGKYIFYGLGNFCFDINQPENSKWNHGYFVELEIGEETIVGMKIHPYEQCAYSPEILLLKDTPKEYFCREIDGINSVICNSDLLIDKFEEYLRLNERERLLELTPFPNKYIRMLQRKNIFPTRLSKKTYMNFYNIISCESHREVILNILKKRIEDE